MLKKKSPVVKFTFSKERRLLPSFFNTSCFHGYNFSRVCRVAIFFGFLFEVVKVIVFARVTVKAVATFEFFTRELFVKIFVRLFECPLSLECLSFLSKAGKFFRLFRSRKIYNFLLYSIKIYCRILYKRKCWKKSLHLSNLHFQKGFIDIMLYYHLDKKKNV